MSLYTMELREILEMEIKIFNNYPIFKEEYRSILENNIINYFYFREIGHETIERFLKRFNDTMLLIMPHYNKLYESYFLDQRILDNYDVTETFERATDSSQQATNNSKNINLGSNTPVTRLDIDSNDYVDNINKSTDENQVQSNNIANEKWLRTMKGNIGIQTDADAINKYRDTLIRIDDMIIKELSIHFMGVF